MLSYGGVAMVTHRSITIHMPACFYSDDNGPITKIQVIVAESGGMTLKKTLTAITFSWIHSTRVSVFVCVCVLNQSLHYVTLSLPQRKKQVKT